VKTQGLKEFTDKGVDYLAFFDFSTSNHFAKKLNSPQSLFDYLLRKSTRAQFSKIVLLIRGASFHGNCEPVFKSTNMHSHITAALYHISSLMICSCKTDHMVA
jgi:hypothetical protein